MVKRILLLSCCFVLFLTGCTSQDEYNVLLSQNAALQSANSDLLAENETLKEQIESIEPEVVEEMVLARVTGGISGTLEALIPQRNEESAPIRFAVIVPPQFTPMLIGLSFDGAENLKIGEHYYFEDVGMEPVEITRKDLEMKWAPVLERGYRFKKVSEPTDEKWNIQLVWEEVTE